MPAQIKICGLSTGETLAAALAAKADFIGLVFYPPSPRYVSIELGARLARQARGKTRIVALTVDADDALLEQIGDTIRPDFIQAHGAETPERIAQIRQRTGSAVIKAIKVKASDDLARAGAYHEVADMLLFDAKAPETLINALPGGNGVAFDWSLLTGRDTAGDFMLSGGLDTANVARAIAMTGAPVVDVSSGVERAPGIKDTGLIEKFIAAAKAGGPQIRPGTGPGPAGDTAH